MTQDHFQLSRPGLTLEARLAPWDAAAFGFPVAQISRIEVGALDAAEEAYQAFQSWVDASDARIVSCRLPHERLNESMFLEGRGFRFVEMVLHPQIEDLRERDLPDDTLTLAPAQAGDMPALLSIALTAFGHERYHVDPRLDPRLGDLRYGRWVEASLDHPTQRLIKIADGQRLVGFMVVETSGEGRAYWHLVAIAPDAQGQGYGRRAWLAMLRRHRDEGVTAISTTISARNIRQLNLYSRLSARFLPPEMTFHWVRADS